MAWQQEAEQLRLQIREHQSAIREIRARLNKLEEKHRRRRRQAWDDDTPLVRLVHPQQQEAYLKLIRKWQELTEDTIIPSKTIIIAFIPKYKSQALRTLSSVLAHDSPVFKISTLQLCKYLSKHTNLGTVESIKKALQRMKKIL